MRISFVVAGVAALSTLAACGGGTSTEAAPPAAAPTSAVSEAPVAAAPGATRPGIPGLTGTPTDVSKPSQAKAGSGQAPTKLLTQDVVVGKGAPAKLTDTVDVRYTGTLYSDGTKFDSSWDSGNAPVNFPLDGVVPGFAQGIAGMAPGGRRVIVIPPDQGYGSSANGPIPANSTLVFVVDLVKVS
jgi:peptidylprolyl isomerase